MFFFLFLMKFCLILDLRPVVSLKKTSSSGRSLLRWRRRTWKRPGKSWCKKQFINQPTVTSVLFLSFNYFFIFLILGKNWSTWRRGISRLRRQRRISRNRCCSNSWKQQATFMLAALWGWTWAQWKRRQQRDNKLTSTVLACWCLSRSPSCVVLQSASDVAITVVEISNFWP